MKKIVLAAHGYMAKGIKSSLEIIAGSVEDIIDINAFTEECQNPENAIREVFTKYDSSEILVFTDVMFGSVNQIFMRLQCKYEFMLVTGMNLPLVMEVFPYIGSDLQESQIKEIIKNAKDTMAYVEFDPVMNDVTDDKDEEL